MIRLIAAMTRQRVIGDKGHLPWHIKDEMHFFKSMTLNSVVIMGRATYDSLGVPLKDRVNIVVSNKMYDIYSKEEQTNLGIIVSRTLHEAIDLAKVSYPDLTINIIGGAKVYEEALEKNIPEQLYISIIEKDYAGDTYFPVIINYDLVETFNHTKDFHVRKYMRKYGSYGT
jgi:dihydrofolate reductase